MKMIRTSLTFVLSALLVNCQLFPKSEHEIACELSRKICKVLDESTSAKIVEYRGYSFVKEQNYDPLTEKILYPPDIAKVSACFAHSSERSRWRCIIEPHHVLFCTNKNGAVTTIRICFHCNQVDFKDGRFTGMSPEWAEKLSEVLPKLGIPVRDNHFYQTRW